MSCIVLQYISCRLIGVMEIVMGMDFVLCQGALVKTEYMVTVVISIIVRILYVMWISILQRFNIALTAVKTANVITMTTLAGVNVLTSQEFPQATTVKTVVSSVVLTTVATMQVKNQQVNASKTSPWHIANASKKTKEVEMTVQRSSVLTIAQDMDNVTIVEYVNAMKDGLVQIAVSIYS